MGTESESLEPPASVSAHGGAGVPRGPRSAAAQAAERAPLLVGAGILLSRLAGLLRDRVLAAFFGTGLYADVFAAGLRIPNVLQNLLGEGTLSASFIPVYSELLERGREREAGRVAGAVFALLLAIAAAISLIGIVLAPLLVTVFVPGFDGERRELTITVTRILFPMTGVLVLSAWTLGVLNSRRKFFVPYFAPVLWNAAIIAALIGFGARLDSGGLVIAAAWGALIGGLLQFGIQLPWVLRLERELELGSGGREPAFREAVRNAGPAILGRGSVQLGAYADLVLASLLAIGAPARLRYAQALYVLPVSLFGMSVAAAALPELARERGAAGDALRQRTAEAARRVAFYVVPSAAAFVVLGEAFVAGLYRTGEFGAPDVAIVWLTLAAYSLGLVAATQARVYQSAFFALRDTRFPARVAIVRVATSALAGLVLMTQFEPVRLGPWEVPAGLLGGVMVGGLPLGPVGLALGAAAGAWTEWGLLRRNLARRLGNVGAGARPLAGMCAASCAAAALGYTVRLALEGLHPLPTALLVAAAFGAAYLVAARVLGLAEARGFTDALLRRRGR